MKEEEEKKPSSQWKFELGSLGTVVRDANIWATYTVVREIFERLYFWLKTKLRLQRPKTGLHYQNKEAQAQPRLKIERQSFARAQACSNSNSEFYLLARAWLSNFDAKGFTSLTFFLP